MIGSFEASIRGSISSNTRASKTGRVTTFLIYYNGITLGTETTKFKEIDGVLVPTSFSQKFEMPMGAFFAEFSVKEAKLNQQLGPDAFAIPH